ncbi:MAG: hypothetical protein U0W40_20410, partial [Acidimicrobiia bacterium]
MRSLDRETAERMLDGRVAPDDAPPGYGVVARVVAVLRSAGGDEAVDRRLGAGAALAGSAGRSGFRLRVAALTAVMGGTVLFGLAGAGALPG